MLLVVGRVGRPHGIRGEVAVEVRTDDPGQRFASGCVLATQPEAFGPLTVSNARPHGGGLIVSFSGVAGRDAAQQLRGAWLVIDSADVPAPDDPDEFHDYQLIGLDVVTAVGCHVGTVADVRHHGQDLLVIRPGGGGPVDSPGPGPGSSPSADVAAGLSPGADVAPGSSPGADVAAGSAAGASVAQRSGPVAGRAGRPATVAGPGAVEILVPFVAAIVPEVDLQAGRLVIDPPPGLLDQNEPA